MRKHRKHSGPTKVQGLSVDAILRQRQPAATFVDDFTGAVLPLKVEPVGAALRREPEPRPLSGDQLHKLAQAQVAQAVDAVLQAAGLSPKPPKLLTLSEAVQRAAVYAQLRGPARGTRR